MKRFEFQGKELFVEAGIRVPRSRLVRVANPDGTPVYAAATTADTPTTAEDEEIRTRVSAAVRDLTVEDPAISRVVVKAQLDMGGRGKAGLITVVGSDATTGPTKDGLADAAGEAARAILSKGYVIPALLLEEAVDIQQELYLSISAEPLSGRYVVLAATEGGVEIEELARTRPDAIKRVYVNPFRGLQAFQSRGLAFDLGLSGALAKEFSQLLTQLYGVFVRYDAELVEINPVFVVPGGALIAGDAKVVIDDNSLGRQPAFEQTREQYESDAAYEAALEGIPYVQFDGNISLMCAGAGLTTTVFDLVNDEGGAVANYLEFGGPNYNKARRAMELCLKNRSAVILIVTFGTIARADVMAEGVVAAIRSLKPDRPIVTCIRGTNEEAAEKTLREAGLDPIYDTEAAVRRAVALAQEARAQGART